MMILRLVIAGALGGLIGYEREAHGRPAGLRTHILVSLGAALFTIVSESYTGRQSDPARIAAQIVSGIGFLGAGTIIRQGSVVRGLTTAASLWTTAAIGMAVGTQHMGGALIYLAIVASIIVFLTLSVINRMEQSLRGGRSVRDLIVILPGGRSAAPKVLETLAGMDLNITSVRARELAAGAVQYRLGLTIDREQDLSRVTAAVAELPEVDSVQWE